MADIAIGLGSYTTTDVASAATCNIGAATTLKVKITGTTDITSFGTSANRIRFIEFEGALILTYNATSLKLPTSANITTAAGDTATAMSDASGNWTVTSYQRRSGLVVAGAAAVASYLEGRAGTWGDPIGSKTFGVDGAGPDLDFTGLTAYRELLLVGFGFQHNTGTPNFLLRFSDEASAWVYDTTGYLNPGFSSATSGILLHASMPAATAVSFRIHIGNFNVASQKTTALVNSGRDAAATGFAAFCGRYDTARAETALRVTNSTTVAWTDYAIYLYGRKG